MILIGDDLVPYEKISTITTIEDIKNTQANSTLLFFYEEKLLSYCYKNTLLSAVVVSSIKQAIYANALDSKYIICNKDLAIKLQKIAENYMFDSKILSIIQCNDELEDIALNEIDGVIYHKILT